MKRTTCFFAAISVLVYTVCAYQTGVQLVNALTSISTATDQGHGSVTLIYVFLQVKDLSVNHISREFSWSSVTA